MSEFPDRRNTVPTCASNQGRAWQTVEHKTHGEYGTVIPDLVLESVYLGEEPGGE